MSPRVTICVPCPLSWSRAEAASPEGTPANVALAQVLVAGRLTDQKLHLLAHFQTLLQEGRV